MKSLDICFDLITKIYGQKRAERSQVPLINHIIEGITILHHLQADEDTKAAYCLHPVVQQDKDLHTNLPILSQLPFMPVLLAMEYRNIANQSLAYKKKTYKEMNLSPLPQVNLMLVADKVQNRKDFRIYHKGSHDDSDNLEYYFTEWMKALGITEPQYEELINLLG